MKTGTESGTINVTRPVEWADWTLPGRWNKLGTSRSLSAMSIGSAKLARHERALDAARRRLRQLEIETHRIKAELARLEANYEDDLADTLTRKLRRRDSNGHIDDAEDRLTRRPQVAGDRVVDHAFADPFVRSVSLADRTGEKTDKAPQQETWPTVGVRKELPPPIAVAAVDAGTGPVRTVGGRTRLPSRKSIGPLALSFIVHAAALLCCLSLTFVTLVQQRIPLFANPVDSVDDIPAPLSEVKIEPTRFEDYALTTTLTKTDEFNLTDKLLADLEPAEVGAGAEEQGGIGQLDALPSDLATLMAGGGKPSSGKPGGELGAAIFFGARSKGDRFVFVIDNSSSMKGGRLDAARNELIRTIERLTPKQSFYVIFVSDQTYPMFFPAAEPNLIPATPANINRLVAWLPKAILASGKNRELIKAMDLAAALRPHAVYLLWDGDLRYSDKVRLDVMTRLTAPNQGNFVIHTIGFNITSADSEQNLTAIAQAHGGDFRRIEVPDTASR